MKGARRHPMAGGRGILLAVVALWASASAVPSLGQSETPEAQAEPRPTLAIPEPARRAPSRRGADLLVDLTYPRASLGWDRLPQALPELLRFAREETELEQPYQVLRCELGNPRLQGAVLVYLTGNDAALEFSTAEKKNLGQYLSSGGLLLADDIRPVRPPQLSTDVGRPGTPFDRQVKVLLRDRRVLGQEGTHWVKIPNDHPLYSSYFRFPAGAPAGSAPGGQVDYLEMLQRRGRVVAILSDLNLGWAWAWDEAPGRLRALRLGVNLLVFSTAQHAAGPALR